MANVVIGKIGRSMYFNRDKWKHAAGNNEAPLLYSSIAKLNPQNTYYLIGKSDFARVPQETIDEWFPHGNIVNVWEGWNSKEDDPTTWIWEQLKDVNIDYGLIHGGMVSLSIPGRIYCLDRKTGLPNYDKFRSPIQSLVNYVSPITYYLNESMIDWMTFTSDGRYMPMQARDMINPEKISLGVKEGSATVKRMKSYEDQETMVEHKVDLRYAAGEFQYLLDYSGDTVIPEDKDKKIALFFHQYSGNKKRDKAIQSFIDHFDDIEVYGKWKDVEDNPKYKGPVNFDELQKILPSVEYTLCYPIIDGDISAKWVEAVRAGIIPFFHESYDGDRILHKRYQFPLDLWVEDAEDMEEKMNALDNNPQVKYELLEHMVSIINHFPKDGRYFNSQINKAVEDMKNAKN